MRKERNLAFASQNLTGFGMILSPSWHSFLQPHLLLEAHHKFSLLSLCVAAQYTDFPDYPSMGSRVTCSINILTGWLRDLWSRWGGRAVDFPWPSTSSCSPPVQCLRCYPRLQQRGDGPKLRAWRAGPNPGSATGLVYDARQVISPLWTSVLSSTH